MSTLKVHDGSGWVTIAGGSTTGVTDHGLLTGLSDDDHPQYALSSLVDSHRTDSLGVSSTVFDNSGSWTAGGGITDHSGLSLLDADDHPQYALSSLVDSYRTDSLGVSSTVFDNSSTWSGGGGDHNLLANLGSNDHPQYVLSATNVALSSLASNTSSTVFDNSAAWGVDNDTTDHTAFSNIGTNTHAQIDSHIASASVHFTEGSIDHGAIGGLADNDHPQYALSSLVDSHRTDSLGVSSTVFDNSAAWAVDNDTTDHTALSNIGTNTHAQIDSHIASASVHFTEASIDHGSIAGLADNDHPQYLLSATYSSTSATYSSLSSLTDTDVISPTAGQVLTWSVSDWTPSTSPTGVTAHNLLTGLAADDHPQYALSSLVDSYRDDSLGVSSTVFDNSAAWAVDTTDHGALTGLGDDDHPQYALSSLVDSHRTDSLGVSSTVFDNSSAWAVDNDTTDHGSFTGLGDNDHPQYLLSATYSSTSATYSSLSSLTDTNITGPITGQVLTWSVSDWTPSTSPAGVTAHNLLTGLAADDHPQYALSSLVDSHRTDSLGVSSTVFDNSAAWATDNDTTDHTLLSNIGTNTHAQIDSHIASASVHFTEASIDHGLIAGLGDDDHTQYVLATGTRDITGGQIVSGLFTASAGINTSGNILVNGTVDGRDVASDGSTQDSHIASASVHFTEASIDHGSIAGLGDNDHPQYALSSLVDSHRTDSLGVSSTVFDNSAAWAVDNDTTDHTAFSNIGTNTHPQIDTHITGLSDVSSTVFDNSATWGSGGTPPTLTKGSTIPLPVSGDSLGLFFTPVAITVVSAHYYIVGTTSVSFNFIHDPVASATGNAVFTAGITASNGTGASVGTGFADATIPALSYVRLDVSGIVGTPDQLHATLQYTED